MAWPQVPKGFLGARLYSARFHYPLSTFEQWFWQVETNLPKPKKNKLVNRSQREQISNRKYLFLKSNLPLLSSNPFILAIFVTGSLSMNNCVENDDIDLMYVTKTNALWLARLWNIFVLSMHHLRRFSHHEEHSSSQVKNTICDNLYLENLLIAQKNLYHAHEILQAKPVYDPYGVQSQFLQVNSWVSNYLPVAYREILKQTQKLNSKSNKFSFQSIGYWLPNFIAFIVQFLYMKPKITNERISLRQAFFHPRQIMI